MSNFKSPLASTTKIIDHVRNVRKNIVNSIKKMKNFLHTLSRQELRKFFVTTVADYEGNKRRRKAKILLPREEELLYPGNTISKDSNR